MRTIITLMFLLLTLYSSAQKIILSDTPFAKDDMVDRKNEFTLKDKIYARLLVPTNLENDVYMAKVGSNYAIQIDLNLGQGKRARNIKRVFVWVSGNDIKNKFLDFDIYPSTDNVNSVYVGMQGSFSSETDMDHVFNGFRDLTSSNHALQVAVFSRNQETTFSGNFKLKIEKGENADEMLRVYFVDQIRSKMVSKFASTQGLPPLFKKSTPSFQDPELSNGSIKKLFMQEFKVEMVFAVAIDDNDTKDYAITLNDLGKPLNKYTARAILVAYKLEGKCKYKSVLLQRDHIGNGKYGKLYFANMMGEPVEVNCDSMK